ncbi:MAG: ferredoxin [Candidatus Altiarchaeales archaeon]|nr:ferredoxin [Candidatus Altiarchaeales archaeon]
MRINPSICCVCGGCVGVCPANALTLHDNFLVCDQKKCVECGLCVSFCPVGALKVEGKK